MPAGEQDELARSRRESTLLKMLQEIAAMANEAGDLQEALQFTLDKVCEYTGWPVGHVYWLTEPGETQLVSSRIWYCPEEASYATFRDATEQTSFNAEEWLGEFVAQEKNGSLWDISAQPYWHHRNAESAGFTSGYALPVLVNGIVRAVLEFYAVERKETDESFLQAMHFVATQLAQVIKRQDTARALSASERRFRALFNQTFQFTWLCQPDGTLVEANQSALTFAGLDRDQVVGEPFWETHWWQTSPDTRKRLKESITEAAEGHFVRFEAEIQGKSDSRATIDFSLKALFDDQGRVSLLILEGRVITNLHEALDKLRRSEALLAQAERVAHLGSWQWDIADDHITWSEEMYRIYGLKRNDFHPTFEGFLELVHPEDRQDVQKTIKDAYESGERFEFSHRIIRSSDGEVRALHARGRSICDDEGTPVRMVGTGQDITERRETEEALGKSEKSYRTLARHIPDAIVVLYDRDLRPILAEGDLVRSARPLLPGFEPEAQVPEGEREDLLKPFRQALKGSAQTFEREHGEHTFLVQTVPVRGEDGQIFAAIAMAQDITERKRIERRLAQRAQQFKALYETGQNITAELNLRRILQLVAEGAQELIPRTERAVLYLRRPGGDGRALSPVAAAGFNEIERALLVDQGDGDDLDESLRQALYEAAERHSAGGPVRGPSLGFASVLTAPVERRGNRLGLLSVKSSASDAFSDEDELLLKMLGRQAAMAIENARLFRAQEQARQTAEILREASSALSKTLDPYTVMESLLDYADKLIGFEKALIVLRRQRNQVRVEAWRGLSLSTLDSRLFSEADVALLDRVWQEESTVIVAGDEVRSKPLSPAVDLGPAGSWLVAPLLAGEGTIGALILGSRPDRTYSEEQATLAGALASQATIAIHNARLFTQVESSQHRLRRLSRKVVVAQEEERLRVARELHDEAGQALTALKITLEMIKSGWPEEAQTMSQQMTEAIVMTDETMEHIRRLAHDLHPPVLETMDLAGALEGLVRDFGKRADFEVAFHSEPIPELSKSIAVSLYRLAQEALTNVTRHADADNVSVELRRQDDMIVEVISDDGKGFDVEETMRSAEKGSGIGLSGMQERIELLNGWVDFESVPGEGTQVSAHVPMERRE